MRGLARGADDVPKESGAWDLGRSPCPGVEGLDGKNPLCPSCRRVDPQQVGREGLIPTPWELSSYMQGKFRSNLEMLVRKISKIRFQNYYYFLSEQTRRSAAGQVRGAAEPPRCERSLRSSKAPQIRSCRSPSQPQQAGRAVAYSPADQSTATTATRGPRLPHPGNGRSTPYHDGRRPQSRWLRHETEDFSACSLNQEDPFE